MGMFLEPKACKACAKSKRKCGREQPACLRCQSRGTACNYPLSRPGTFVAILDDAPPTVNTAPTPSLAITSTNGTPEASIPSARCVLSRPPLSPSTASAAIVPPGTPSACHTPIPPISSHQCLAWFLNTNSWKIEHSESSVSTAYSSSFLKMYVARMQDWLAQWADTGTNPFIHLRLYDARFPDNLQIAYTTLTTYLNRTKHNAELVLDIVENQASKLVDSSDDGILSGGSDASHDLSLLDQCARLHALVVYQTISLFDGDIRARHLAEGRLPLLSRWAMQLVESARQKFSSTSAVLDMTTALYFGPMDSHEHPWYLWILTESIRRAWLIANGLNAIYCMLQRGWHPCPGSVMFTTRRGLWDAPSALEWEANCSVGAPEGVGFMPRFALNQLFRTSTPDQVDDFTLLMMEITYGIEPVQKWQKENTTKE
ncbi:RNA polymerase 2 mediator complex component [Sporothrix brasiliensis 5110]|uniref:RNA polymerase 2 mediator complex component n=1 Tax=Sporothrix brasiliensis 5110 TaxID=1398154 RepID=A0A0C2IXK9_9PEZI|nr:RNA polymerase 2 mediator complex component [Sporothrix brasiliensis 5110]KIH89757.1 RNA polymerase 2 mediator complex component [Sporothrix brasiliensis 5110]